MRCTGGFDPRVTVGGTPIVDVAGGVTTCPHTNSSSVTTQSSAAPDAIDGIVVQKSLERSEFVFPAVEYRLVSERSVPVTVSLEQPLPEGVTVEQIGFHSEFRSQNWNVEDGRLCFEAALEQGEAMTTVIGVREVDDDKLEALCEGPPVVTVDPPADAEAGESSADGEDAAATGDSRSTRDDAGATTASWGEDVAQRPDASESSAPGQRSFEARLRHLQSDVADLRAYTAALEDFIDENGTAQAVIDRFDGRIGAVEEDLADLAESVASHDDALDRHDEALDSHDRTLADHDERLGRNEDVLDAHTESLERHDDILQGQETTLDEHAGTLDEHDDALADHDETIESVADRLQRLEATLEGVDDLAATLERLDRLEDDIEEVNAWRDNLRHVFSE